MESDNQTPDEHKETGCSDSAQAPSGRFSLYRLAAAFAQLSGTTVAKPSTDKLAGTLEDVHDDSTSVPATQVLSPRMIVEGMLFVGNADGRPLTSAAMAAPIRDVSPEEVDQLIVEINQTYDQHPTSYQIVTDGSGYRMRLRPEFEAMGQRFRGRVREAKLTLPAIEVLSVVAYRQPVTSDDVRRLRGARSDSILNSLVRRGLLCVDRPTGSPRNPTYQTTDRFNRLFHIDSPRDLPNSEDLDDS